MTIITIQCRLTASEATRRHLWELMADRNTPFVGTLMEAIKAHENFSAWQRWGEVPLKAVDQISKPLRKDERFSGQPGRFYSSANIMTTYTYKAWFALQASRHRRLEGLQRWVAILKSDAEMLEICNVSLDTLQSRAQAILQDVTSVVAKEVEAQSKSRQRNRTQPQQAATIVPGCISIWR